MTVGPWLMLAFYFYGGFLCENLNCDENMTISTNRDT